MRFSYRRHPEDEKPIEVEVIPLPERDGAYRITVGSRVFELSARLFHHAAFLKEAGEITLQYEGREYHLFEAARRHRTVPRKAGDLHAPMAGKVIKVLVQPGDPVTAGDPLLILEAMKMEQQIVAPQDGVVTRLLCREGDQVTAGMELVIVTSQKA